MKTKKRKKTNKYAGSSASKITIRRKIGLYYGRFVLFMKLSLAVSLCLFIFTGFFSRTKEFLATEFYNTTAMAGFRLENVIIQGQKNVTSKEIIAAIDAKKGAPILSIPISTVQQTLQDKAWVKSCIVERRLPDTLFIALFERNPIAVWQFNKKLYLIDENGDRISNQKIEHFSKLLHVVGEGGNLYAKNLIDDLSKCPELASRVHSAVRYGNRRWNIILDENIIVKMPEDNFKNAYNYLQKLFKENKLFNNSIKTIDLRLPDRYFYEKR